MALTPADLLACELPSKKGNLESVFKVTAGDQGQGASGAQRRSALKVLERAHRSDTARRSSRRL